ncbi:methyl-accepting chemotaxis protein [Pseudomonas sp. BN515]|nr:methyl-accepting chemotaxis protein [Pseudomonas sp. BN515]
MVVGINERNLLIAAASEEQAQVAREVDRNLVIIRDLSVQTAAGAQQTSVATQELARLTSSLNGLVRQFRLWATSARATAFPTAADAAHRRTMGDPGVPAAWAGAWHGPARPLR